jgi:hypothetical protein
MSTVNLEAGGRTAARAVHAFTGCVKEGQFKPDTVTKYRGILARFEGRRVTVTVEAERKHRSLPANARYWGLIVATMSEWSGFEKDECHELLKAMFLPRREVNLPTGEAATLAPSTADMLSDDFYEYTSRCERWLVGQGVYLEAQA